MKKQIAVLISFFLCVMNVRSQSDNNVILTALFKDQKNYITNTIQEKQQSKYLTVLHFANVIRPKVLSEIQKLNATFPADQNINIVEGFTGYISFNGVIWQDSIYYAYNYGSDKKLTIQQRSFSQLSDTTKNIVQNFGNWNSPTFSINGQALSAPTDHPFFLASKYSAEAVATIGFYYQ